MSERPPIIVCHRMEEIVPVLRHEMKLKSVSQIELGAELGVSGITANRMLTGKTSMSIEQLYRILSYLGLGLALAPSKSEVSRPVQEEPSRKAPVDLGVTLKDLFTAGLITAGDILNGVPTRWQDTVAEVGLRGDLILEDGSEYTSPSTAAKEVRGTTTNGWSFWALNGRTLDALRRELIAGK